MFLSIMSKMRKGQSKLPHSKGALQVQKLCVIGIDAGVI